jgi:hypothetical protein
MRYEATGAFAGVVCVLGGERFSSLFGKDAVVVRLLNNLQTPNLKPK